MSRRLYLRIMFDPDTDSPCEYDGFKLYSFNRRHASFCDPEKLPLSPLALRNKLRAGTAFWLDYYEHGLCCWSLAGDGPQDQWDTARRAGLLIWEEPAKHLGSEHTYEGRRKQAESFLETYTDWCNGNTFWYQLEDELEAHVDSCGGFIGDEHLIDGLNEVLEPDDVVCIRESRDLDTSYIAPKLKCRVLKTSYFPTEPQPEFMI